MKPISPEDEGIIKANQLHGEARLKIYANAWTQKNDGVCVLCQLGWTADSANLITDLDQLARTMSPLAFHFNILAHKDAKKRIKNVASRCTTVRVTCYTWDENTTNDATNLETMLQLPIIGSHAILIISDSSAPESSRSGDS